MTETELELGRLAARIWRLEQERKQWERYAERLERQLAEARDTTVYEWYPDPATSSLARWWLRGGGCAPKRRPVESGRVTQKADSSHGMERTEVRCAKCEGHLGHVFPDGPGPEGLRYCINSAALDFEGDDEAEGQDG